MRAIEARVKRLERETKPKASESTTDDTVAELLGLPKDDALVIALGGYLGHEPLRLASYVLRDEPEPGRKGLDVEFEEVLRADDVKLPKGWEAEFDRDYEGDGNREAIKALCAAHDRIILAIERRYKSDPAGFRRAILEIDAKRPRCWWEPGFIPWEQRHKEGRS
jgi:hypothetical protein